MSTPCHCMAYLDRILIFIRNHVDPPGLFREISIYQNHIKCLTHESDTFKVNMINIGQIYHKERSLGQVA